MRQAAAIPALLALLVLAAVPAGATTITIMNANTVGIGFNDPTPVAPVAGNAGTTLGQQRLNVFMAAAGYWSNRLSSSVPITVSAQMIPLDCTPTSALLGSAGPTDFSSDFTDAPGVRAATWYPSALANALAGSDVEEVAGTPEIEAQFNTRLDNVPTCLSGIHWDYSIGGASPANTLPFYQTVLHEIAHGLGFLTVVNLATGALAQGQDDVFELFLEDHSTGKTWGQMTNSQRVTSAKDTGDLHWVGPHVVAASPVLSAGRHPSGHVLMYAPKPLESGSSVSHWDTTVTPDELLEPFATLNPHDLLTTHLLNDIGWTLQTPGACVPGVDTACVQSGRFEVKVIWETSTGTGSGNVMSFGGQQAENDESSFWWFFSPANFEMGVKVLNACAVNDSFWVYTSGLTDQGWTVHVRDTVTGATETYSNALGHLSSTFADTNAFSCL